MRSKGFRLVQENRATVKPDFSVAPRGMKTYSESKIELGNLGTENVGKLKSVFVIRAAL